MRGLDRFREDWGWVTDYVEAWPLDLRASYESETGVIHVVESMWCFWSGASLKYMLLPRTWGEFMARGVPTGLGPLHDDVDAVWTWRPLIYEWEGCFGGEHFLRRLGSQMELEWRYGVAMAAWYNEIDDEDRFRRVWERVRDRARDLLREHLTPQQALDLEAWGRFYVRGKVNKLYGIQPGNGFEICDPVTREAIVSYCLHPENWLPDADVALATKLLLEQGQEGEEEALSCGRAYPIKGEKRERTGEDLVAAGLEFDLY